MLQHTDDFSSAHLPFTADLLAALLPCCPIICESMMRLESMNFVWIVQELAVATDNENNVLHKTRVCLGTVIVSSWFSMMTARSPLTPTVAGSVTKCWKLDVAFCRQGCICMHQRGECECCGFACSAFNIQSLCLNLQLTESCGNAKYVWSNAKKHTHTWAAVTATSY